MSSSFPALEALMARRSVPHRQLGEPGPDRAQIERMLACAVRVPDHGRLTPWRFVLIEGETRAELGERLAGRALQRDPATGVAALEKERQRFRHAPTTVAVVGQITRGHKVPEQEQLLSGGAVCFSLLQAAQALGFGAQWLTGWAAYDPGVADMLGLAGHERVLGFIHIGTAQAEAAERERPDPLSLLTELRL